MCPTAPTEADSAIKVSLKLCRGYSLNLYWIAETAADLELNLSRLVLYFNLLGDPFTLMPVKTHIKGFFCLPE
jgi:hypothetical protein